MRFVAAIANAHAAGAKVDWAAFFAGTAAKRVALPTYPFQRRRYWLDPGQGAGDLRAAGQAAAEHPLLGAAVELAGEGEGLLLTGRVSLATHPWLADHRVAGNVLLPGTVLLELALAAAEQAGAEGVEELTMQAPLALPESGAVAIQVSVSAPARGRSSRDRDPLPARGRRGRVVSKRRAASSPRRRRRSPGRSTPGPPRAPSRSRPTTSTRPSPRRACNTAPPSRGSPPPGRDGDDIYVEAALPEEQSQSAERFAIHPALLDAALHGIALSAADGELKLPFAWSGASVGVGGARELRARISPTEGGVSIVLADGAGEPLGRVEGLALRPVDPRRSESRAPGRKRPDGDRLDRGRPARAG